MPIFKSDHWSLLVLQNIYCLPPTKKCNVYHLDSRPGTHDINVIWKIVNDFIIVTTSIRKIQVSPVTLKVQNQSNNVDCGVFTVHFMDCICRYIAKNGTKNLYNEILSCICLLKCETSESTKKYDMCESIRKMVRKISLEN